jgi:imidazolonepropionase-like amidohydrolase
VIAAVFLTLAAPLVQPAPQGAVFAVEAKELYLGDGRRVENGVLVVEGGKIRAAGAGVDVPNGVPVVRHDGVVSAGLVACRAFDGASGENHDWTRSVLPGARVVDAFDPDHTDFERALSAGITTLVLSPSTGNLVGGITAVVKTAGGRVVKADGHLAISLDPNALVQNRYPTSSSGAVAELESRMKTPRGAFADVATGRRLVLISAHARADVENALGFATRHGLKGALVGAVRAGDLLRDVQSSGLGVVVGPLRTGTSQKVIESVVALGEARVPLAFALDTPLNHPDSLRLAAALCVRGGLDGDVAWKALTSDGARIAGVGDRLGRLERGLDADFVLWSGDPLDLSSSVVEVYVDGARVFGGAK